MEAKEVETQNADKWDFVILHSEEEYDLARTVRDSLQTLYQTVGRQVTVEIFADLYEFGTIKTNIFDYITENSSIIMFFRSESFFSDSVNNFGLASGLEDRLDHKERRRHWTVVPLDIEKKTKIRGKASINVLGGVTVTEKGDIKDKETKLKLLLDKARGANGYKKGLEQSKEEGVSHQVKEVSSPVPSPPGNDTPLATCRCTTDNKVPAETVLSGSQSVAERTTTSSRPPNPLNSTAEKNRTLFTYSTNTSFSGVSLAPRGKTKDILKMEQRLTDLPTSVVLDNTSIVTCSPPIGSRPVTTEQQRIRSSEHAPLFWQQVAPDSCRSPQSEWSQREHSQNSLQQYWNLMGARPKTTPANFPMFILSHEQHERQQSMNPRQKTSQEVTQDPPERPHASHVETVFPSLSSDPSIGDTTTNSSDGELRKIMDGLRETSLTPPPSLNFQEIRTNTVQQCPQNTLSPNATTSLERQESSILSDNFLSCVQALPPNDDSMMEMTQQDNSMKGLHNLDSSEEDLRPADDFLTSRVCHPHHTAESSPGQGRRPRQSHGEPERLRDQHQYEFAQQGLLGEAPQAEGFPDLRSLGVEEHQGLLAAHFSVNTEAADSGKGITISTRCTPEPI